MTDAKVDANSTTVDFELGAIFLCLFGVVEIFKIDERETTRISRLAIFDQFHAVEGAVFLEDFLQITGTCVDTEAEYS